MSRLEILTGKNYLSHSSLTSWLDCGERYRLERIENVPQQKSWWLVGGSAFHKASEYLDLGTEENTAAAWKRAWDEQYAEDIPAGSDHSKIRAGGRVSKQWPEKENIDWWQETGPDMLVKYVEWRDAKFAEGWQWFRLPDGSAAIEVPVQLVLNEGTDDQVLVKGYIDRVMVTDDGELLVNDLKSGSRQPASTLQLGIYAQGFARAFGVTPILGGYYMSRKAELTGPVSLLHYTPELIGRWFGMAQEGISDGIFIPHVSSFCGTCSVKPYCSAYPAPLATTGFKATIATSTRENESDND